MLHVSGADGVGVDVVEFGKIGTVRQSLDIDSSGALFCLT